MTAVRRPSRDGLLAGATFVASFWFSVSAASGRMGPAAGLVVAAAAAGSVLLSARRPVAALAAVAVFAAALPLIGSTFPAMNLVVVVVAFQAVLKTELSPWVVAAVCLVLLTGVDAWQRVASGRGFGEPDVLYPLVLTALVMELGLQSRRVRRQHDELLALREADRRQAVYDERRRIARDLHDIAAHHLSALIVRSELAKRIGTPHALEEAVTFSASTATDALRGLRASVQVLAADDAAPLAPAPQLSDLGRVVATVRAAGLHVETQLPLVEGDVVPVEVALAAVRIAGEALANVLQHRGPGRAWLIVERASGSLVVRVDDDGPGTWDPEAADTAWFRPGHHGVVGMRERARSCGGILEISHSPRGGWRVEAALPVPEQTPAPTALDTLARTRAT